jgi:hypothetical protein
MRKRSIAAVMAVIMTAIFLYDVAKIMKLTRQLPWKKIKILKKEFLIFMSM